MKLKEQDFAQRRWKVLILESSHCRGFLPFASCYINSKTVSTKVSVKTHRGILEHIYPSLHRLSSFLLLSSPACPLLKGPWCWSAVCPSQWGRFQSFGFAVSLSVAWSRLHANCLYSLGVFFFPLCFVRMPCVLCYGREYVGYGRGRLCVACRAYVCFVLQRKDLRLPLLGTNMLAFPYVPLHSPEEHLHSSSRPDSLKNSGIKCTRIFHCRAAWAFLLGLNIILKNPPSFVKKVLIAFIQFIFILLYYLTSDDA